MKHLNKLSLLLLALLLPATATAYDFEVDGIYYNINGNEATVTYRGTNSWNHNTYSGDVTIPLTVTYNGTTYSVTSIGSNAFYYCTGLTSVDIPDSVTSIGNSAFSGCSGLTSIDIPNSITSIGNSAFRGCSGLTNIDIPNSVTTIDDGAFSGTAWYNNQPDGLVYAGLVAYKYKGTMPSGTSITIREGTLGIAGSAFYDCFRLTSITIPNSVTNIGEDAFSYCRSLTSINIPNSVTAIGDEAFRGCSGLTSVTIGNSVTSIGYGVFFYCSGLTSISVAGGNSTYDSRNNCNAIIETATNTLITGCMNTIIPNSVITISGYAFQRCSSLTSITIPNSVTTIGNGAFYGCSGLTSVSIPNSVTSIGYSAFSGCSGLTSATIGNSVTTIGGAAFYNCSALTSVTIPNSVTSIGDSTFYNCSGLTSVSIPNSVTSIGYSAFSGCSSITSIVVASGNPTYDSRENCNAIIETSSNTLITGCQNTTIPNSVTSIGEDAFSYCRSLTSIIIPNSVTTIGDGAFMECSGLTSIIIPNSVTYIGGGAFNGTAWYDNQPDGLVYAGLVAYGYKGSMPSEANIILREGTLGIASGAFSWRPLTSITIPKSVIYIGYAAFYECVVTRVDISDIAAWCNIRFEGICTNPLSCSGGSGFLYLNGTKITELNIPNSVTSIKDYAFDGCGGLTGVTIPNSVTSIGESAFERCTGLTSITIPNSVTTIGSSAFENCSGLTSVTISNSVISIRDRAFYVCTGLTSVTIGNSVTSIGNYAFSRCSALTDIYCWALTPPSVSENTFSYSTDSNCYGATLYVPKESVNAYKAAYYWKNFTNIVGIDYVPPVNTFEVDGIYYRVKSSGHVSVIANEDVSTLYTGDVVIPDSVTYERYTFAVTGIESNAFEDCYELTSITIPNSVETIGEQAFQGCTGLTSLTIGSGVTAIGTKAFNYCNALETVKCLGTVPPVMASSDCFSTAAYNRATLLVPRNTEATYTAADFWYKFAHIYGWGSAGRGDIDGDGEVSIRDVTTMIDAILTGEHEGVYFESADLNLNGRLDIGDVTTIIDMLLNGV